MPLEYIALMMVVAFFLLVLTGMPVAFAIAAVGFVFGFIGFDGWLFELLPARIFGTITNYTLLAIPLFVFMGVMLDKTRVAERMLDVIGHACGALPGGMALAVILVGVLMGAATGIVGAAIVTLTLMALPTLLRRGYKRTVACGTICASGTLGQIIPPSLVLLVLADTMNLSVGACSPPRSFRDSCWRACMWSTCWSWPGSTPPTCPPSTRRSARTSAACNS